MASDERPLLSLNNVGSDLENLDDEEDALLGSILDNAEKGKEPERPLDFGDGTPYKRSQFFEEAPADAIRALPKSFDAILADDDDQPDPEAFRDDDEKAALLLPTSQNKDKFLDRMKKLKDKIHGVPTDHYLKLFDNSVKPDTLVVGAMSMDDIELQEKAMEEDRIKNELIEEEKHKRRRKDVRMREIAAREHVFNDANKRARERELREWQRIERDRQRANEIKRAFRKAEDHLKKLLRDRKGEVAQTYGRVVDHPVQAKMKNKRFKVDWSRTPQPVRINLRMLRAVKEKLPRGNYVLLVSMYDRLGGKPLTFSKLRGKQWLGVTRPVPHGGIFIDYEMKVEQSVFAVCPSRPQMVPSMVFMFELFILKGPNSNIDRVVAWGAYPVSDPKMDVVKGKFKVPLLRGEVDPTIEKFSSLQKVWMDDLDMWLCNLYFEVEHLSRYIKGQKEFEVSLKLTEQLLNVTDKKRKVKHWDESSSSSSSSDSSEEEVAPSKKRASDAGAGVGADSIGVQNAENETLAAAEEALTKNEPAEKMDGEKIATAYQEKELAPGETVEELKDRILTEYTNAVDDLEDEYDDEQDVAKDQLIQKLEAIEDLPDEEYRQREEELMAEYESILAKLKNNFDENKGLIEEGMKQRLRRVDPNLADKYVKTIGNRLPEENERVSWDTGKEIAADAALRMEFDGELARLDEERRNKMGELEKHLQSVLQSNADAGEKERALAENKRQVAMLEAKYETEQENQKRAMQQKIAEKKKKRAEREQAERDRKRQINEERNRIMGDHERGLEGLEDALRDERDKARADAVSRLEKRKQARTQNKADRDRAFKSHEDDYNALEMQLMDEKEKQKARLERRLRNKKKGGGATGEQAQKALDEHQVEMTNLERKLDDEMSKQKKRMQDRLARRKKKRSEYDEIQGEEREKLLKTHKAEVQVLEKSFEAEKNRQKRRLEARLARRGRSDKEKERLIKEHNNNMDQLERNLEREKERQAQDLESRLLRKKAGRAALKQSKAEIEREHDEEMARIEKDYRELRSKKEEELQRKLHDPTLSQEERERLFRSHTDEMDALDSELRNERDRQAAALEAKIGRRMTAKEKKRAELEAEEEINRLEQKYKEDRAKQLEWLRGQLSKNLSREERDRVMKEHDEAMKNLEEALSTDVTNQREKLAQRLEERRKRRKNKVTQEEDDLAAIPTEVEGVAQVKDDESQYIGAVKAEAPAEKENEVSQVQKALKARRRALTTEQLLDEFKYSVNQPSGVFELKAANQKLLFIQRILFNDLNLRVKHLFGYKFYFGFILLLLAFWARMYVHYFSEWVILSAFSVPLERFAWNIFNLDVFYQYETVSLIASILVVISGPIGNMIVFTFFMLAAWFAKLCLGSFPDSFSKYTALFGIMMILDPYITFAFELLLAVSVQGEYWNADAFKLYNWYLADEGNGIPGIVITLLFYAALTTISCFLFYWYMFSLYLNGRISDLFRRLHGNHRSFFIPDDLEVTAKEIKWICEKAERWRGSFGARRKVKITDEEVTDAKDPNFLQITTHVDIFTIQTDGSKDRYRKFVRLPDGTIKEIFMGQSSLVESSKMDKKQKK